MNQLAEVGQTNPNEKTYSRDKSGNLVFQLLMMRQSPGVSFSSHEVNALSLRNTLLNIMTSRQQAPNSLRKRGQIAICFAKNWIHQLNLGARGSFQSFLFPQKQVKNLTACVWRPIIVFQIRNIFRQHLCLELERQSSNIED